MSSSGQATSVSPREYALLCAVLLAAPLAALVVAGPYYFDRPFWSDEVLSWLIASDPSFGHGMAALAGGVDTNAPLMHLLFRIVGAAFGSTPAVYRLTALVAMLIAIAGLYLTLRRTTSALSSTFGCMCFAALPMVIAHATEARFYAFELAAAVWTNYWLLQRGMRAGPSPVRSSEQSPGRGRPGSHGIRIALGATALCGVHYFGVLALASIVFAHLVKLRLSWRSRVDLVWPTIAGFATTACLLPLVIAQRTAMRDAGGTWVPDAFWTNLRVTVDMLVPPCAMVVAMTIALISIAKIGVRQLTGTMRKLDTPIIATLAYLAMMLAFDRVIQPVFVPRYFIVVLPIVAVLAAGLASCWPATVTRLAIVVVALCLAVQWIQIRHRAESPDSRAAAALIASTASVEISLPIFSDWLGHALPIIQARPALRERVRYLADTRLHEEGFESGIRYEREMAACVQRFYGLPGRASIRDVESLDRLVLISEFPETIPQRFPRYVARKLSTVTFELTRTSEAKVD